AVTPIGGVVPTAALIACISLQIYNGPFSAYTSVGMSFITLVNPIVTIACVRTYREGLLDLLRLPHFKGATSPTNIAPTSFALTHEIA
ncbi:hypothetical protein AAVH_36984, partial [Aphelenchoides avenae]